jgi:hypothetical protein
MAGEQASVALSVGLSQRIAMMFAPDEIELVSSLLTEECSPKLTRFPVLLDRIRYAVLKLSKGDLANCGRRSAWPSTIGGMHWCGPGSDRASRRMNRGGRTSGCRRPASGNHRAGSFLARNRSSIGRSARSKCFSFPRACWWRRGRRRPAKPLGEPGGQASPIPL